MVFSAALALSTMSNLPKPDDLLHLHYNKFESLNNGWRLYAVQKKYKEAAILIQEYLSINNKLDKSQISTLYFHLGQMYALADNNKKAVLAFNKALIENGDEKQQLKNAYIKATIAFIEDEKGDLDNAIKFIENGAKDSHGKTPHLDAVQLMKKHIFHKYNSIYDALKE
ncbi:MAG: hypothetical protein WC222_05355 [Parachlamydiales bacterium]|jgi:tetratricopeptide (TPR) repeat protein